MITNLKTIQAAANGQHAPAVISWAALNKLNSQRGAPLIDFDGFVQRYDEDPALQSIVSSYSDQGVVLNTDVSSDGEVPSEEPDKSQVSKMAKRATSKALRK